MLLEGKLRTDIIDGLGNEVMIEYIIAPRTFATPHLFNSDNTLPATFTALEYSVVLMATKDSTFKVISQDPQVLHNFLCIAGNCNICTVSRLKPLSRKTVRERFIVYLFEHKKKDSLIVEITHTQSQLAEYLNVSRPALSKEINKIIKGRTHDYGRKTGGNPEQSSFREIHIKKRQREVWKKRIKHELKPSLK